MDDIFTGLQWYLQTDAPTPEGRLDRTGNWHLLPFLVYDKVKLPSARSSQTLEVTIVELLENDDGWAGRGKGERDCRVSLVLDATTQNRGRPTRNISVRERTIAPV